MLLEIKSKAPKFSLKDKDGKVHHLHEIDSDFIVLYFYPKDSTPGCTIEAREFNKLLPQFKNLNTSVVAISGGDDKSKAKFCERNKLGFTLLSDPDFKVSKEYGVYGKKSFLGKSYLGITRTTYILDKKTKIIKVYPKVQPFGHAKNVLDFISSLNLISK